MDTQINVAKPPKRVLRDDEATSFTRDRASTGIVLVELPGTVFFVDYEVRVCTVLYKYEVLVRTVI